MIYMEFKKIILENRCFKYFLKGFRKFKKKVAFLIYEKFKIAYE